MIEYRCDRCGVSIRQPVIRYTLRMELYAAKEDIIFSETDLEQDHLAEMERLVQQMEQMEPEELIDDVHVRYEFDLCHQCRNILYRGFKKPFPLANKDKTDDLDL